MEPSTLRGDAPINTTCVTCDGPLTPGNRLRCDLCIRVAAAHQAIEEAGGRTVLPSDVARARERLERSGT